MRLWPTLLLGSALLLGVAIYLHFFNPDLKSDLRNRRKVEYKSFKTLKTNETEVRRETLERRNKPKPINNNKGSVISTIRDVRERFGARCDAENKFFNENPDLIDPKSPFYKNIYKAKELITNILFGHVDAIHNMALEANRIDKAISSVSDEVDGEQLLKLIMSHEDLVRNCGLSDTVGPALMGFSEAVSMRNAPDLKYLIRPFTSLARASFAVKTFNGFEIGLGALRNMNSFGLLSPAETEDLENLSLRVETIYDNYRREVGSKSSSVSELQETFLYYQVEREVLFQILYEYVDNLEKTYLVP